MSCSRLFSFNDFVESFKRGELDSLYLVKTVSMTYTGLIRSVSEDSLIMDLPLKFYAGQNVIYTPVIIAKEEIVSIKQVPISDCATIETKNGTFSGEIENVYSNRMIINSKKGPVILYYQDFLDVE
ncbi:hypothetical protein [Ferroplasma sp.]|uniref:hypothetical protein n=1 Tax=Ferroplasma sp. TaxID=2591003 RepID=UPI00307F343B